MKNDTQPAVTKLVKKFDNTLKSILRADLEAFKAKHQFVNNTMTVNAAVAA